MNPKMQHVLCNAAFAFFTALTGLKVAGGIPDSAAIFASFWAAFLAGSLAAVTTWKGQLEGQGKVALIAAMALPLQAH